MKNKFKFTLIVSALGLVLAGTTVTAFVLSKKTPDTIYVSNEDELFSISEKLDGYYSLACDISITKPWKPIGTKEKPFTGTIMGNYKTIVFTETSLEFIESDYDFSWGFIGCNQGNILRTNFYGLKIEDNFNMPVNFGSFAIDNYGQITSCTLKNCNIRFSAPNVNFGSFVCNNYGEIKNCHLRTNFIIDVIKDNSTVGGICSVMHGGKIEYCSVAKTCYLMINVLQKANRLFLGNAVGILKEGIILDCYLTSATTSIKGNCDVSSIGGVAGCYDGSGEVKLSSLFLDLNSYIYSTNSDLIESNGTIGYVLNKSGAFVAENLLLDISATLTTEEDCTSKSYATFSDSGAFDNSYLLEHITSAKYKNSDGVISIDRSQLSLKLLKWDEAIWRIKDGEVIFLKGI